MFPYDVSIHAAMREAWPGTCLGCLVYSVKVEQKNPGLWAFYEDTMAAGLVRQLEEVALADMPGVGDSRAAYKAFGADPGRQRVSSEALYRRVRQGKGLYQVNSLVDVNNVVSLQCGFSLGSYNLANLGEAIVFRKGAAGESYQGIGKAAIGLENMPLLSDEQGAFGCPSSDSERAMITLDTTKALTVIYSFNGREKTEETLRAAEEMFAKYGFATNMETWVV